MAKYSTEAGTCYNGGDTHTFEGAGKVDPAGPRYVVHPKDPSRTQAIYDALCTEHHADSVKLLAAAKSAADRVAAAPG